MTIQERVGRLHGGFGDLDDEYVVETPLYDHQRARDEVSNHNATDEDNDIATSNAHQEDFHPGFAQSRFELPTAKVSGAAAFTAAAGIAVVVSYKRASKVPKKSSSACTAPDNGATTQVNEEKNSEALVVVQNLSSRFEDVKEETEVEPVPAPPTPTVTATALALRPSSPPPLVDEDEYQQQLNLTSPETPPRTPTSTAIVQPMVQETSLSTSTSSSTNSIVVKEQDVYRVAQTPEKVMQTVIHVQQTIEREASRSNFKVRPELADQLTMFHLNAELSDRNFQRQQSYDSAKLANQSLETLQDTKLPDARQKCKNAMARGIQNGLGVSLLLQIGHWGANNLEAMEYPSAIPVGEAILEMVCGCYVQEKPVEESSTGWWYSTFASATANLIPTKVSDTMNYYLPCASVCAVGFIAVWMAHQSLKTLSLPQMAHNLLNISLAGFVVAYNPKFWLVFQENLQWFAFLAIVQVFMTACSAIVYGYFSSKAQDAINTCKDRLKLPLQQQVDAAETLEMARDKVKDLGNMESSLAWFPAVILVVMIWFQTQWLMTAFFSVVF